MKQSKCSSLRIKKRKSYFELSGLLYFALLLLLLSCKTTNDKSITSIEEYLELRKEKLNRPRPLIHNNDGGDAKSFPLKYIDFMSGNINQPSGDFLVYTQPGDTIGVDYEFSIENFLNIRSAGLLGSDVSTISYCSSRAFSLFIHNTKVGEVWKWEWGESRPDRLNAVPEFLKLGTDPLEVTADFAHENGFEFFWSHRINDTHDAAHRPDRPHDAWTVFKEKHPEYLFGEIGERLPYGRWSAVDFSNTQIRDLTVQYYTEVCENYDVDGIELDFFRHMYLFEDVARGKVATQEQLDMITEMLTRIRKMTERVGMEKGNPILVLVRLPDGIEYCRGVGLDLERWMKEGLIDIVTGSCYFRLNPWEYLVEQGQMYGVKVYAGLSESRIRDGQHPDLIRQQNAVYRARSAAAWQAGVDGIYSFNQFNTRARYFSEIGQADKLYKTNNLYFVTYRNHSFDHWSHSYLKGGKKYANLPALSPITPVLVKSPVNFIIEIGNESEPSDVFLILYADEADPKYLKASLNNVPASFSKSTGEGLFIFNVSQESVLSGNNELTVSYNKGDEELTLLDAAILFYRNPDDQEINDLALICFQ